MGLFEFSTMADYESLVRRNEFVEDFMPCNNSPLRQTSLVVHSFNHETCGHDVIEQCKNRHDGYFTCITFKSDSNAVKKHNCNSFLVIIGSCLDRDIYKLLYPQSYRANNPVFSDLYGMIYVDASLCHFSNLLTNRKELVHKVKRGTGVFCLYLYDNHDRGHKLTIDENNRILYRNHRGEEKFIDKDNCSFDSEFSVDVKHLDLAHMAVSFARLNNQRIDIDSLENKNILSPINILHRALLIAMRDPKAAASYLTRGEIEKFASLNIAYTERGSGNVKYNCSISKNTAAGVKGNKGDVAATGGRAATKSFIGINHTSSFNYKKLQPNQVILSRDTWDRSVVRPIPKNVSVSSIPKNTQYFLCLAEKSINIDSPNRWLTLLPEVVISNHILMGKFPRLNEIIQQMCRRKYFKKRKPGAAVSPNERVVLVSGGLITRYFVNPQCSAAECVQMFIEIKRINPFVEIYTTSDFLMLNLNTGIPFRLLIGGEPNAGEMLMVSPLELCTTFREFSHANLDSLSLFGPNCSSSLKDLAQYITVNKLMAAVNYLRNKFSFTNALRYFELTNENICVYMDRVGYDGADPDEQTTKTKPLGKRKTASTGTTAPGAAAKTCKRQKTNAALARCPAPKEQERERPPPMSFDKNKSTISLNVLFSSHPQITADSYILDKNLKVDSVLVQRNRFEFEFNHNTNIHFNDLSKTEFMDERDAAGNVLRKYIHIATIDKLGGGLKFHSFPQIKLKIIETKSHTGCRYQLYKFFDEAYYLSAPSERIEISVLATMERNRRAVQKSRIDVITKIRLNTYEGIKPSEQCGQKGLASRQDVSRYSKLVASNVRPNIVGSVFSLIGRSPLIQMKTVERNLIPNTPDCLFGPYEFSLLKNVSSTMRSHSSIRMDLYSAKIFTTNNAPRALYTLIQQAFSEHERNTIMPEDNIQAMGILSILKADIKLKDQYNNSMSTCQLMSRDEYEKVCQSIDGKSSM